ncbi:MAG TPA: class I SAM-dependent methyltransferase [Bacteroidia bacterium]|nr:class I SAM-dependent methyltransferase [Bacteroidia bacterium]HRS58101.1 class I SAM-dependent methyltransferase [Bacteroidia bacterium]HRU66878.1 class I SAM-dependent methyltransferase [Bacteroidia bacterium]
MKQNIIGLIWNSLTKSKVLKNSIYPIKMLLSEEIRKRDTLRKYNNNQPTGLPFIDIRELIPQAEETIESYTYLDETSRITDIAVIKSLCRQYPDCHYLEIGSWRGESLFNASQVAKTCVSVSLPDDEVRRIWGERAAKVTRMFTRNIPNIIHVEADSQTFDYDTLGLKFDVIFIDGDHSYQGVLNDTRKVLSLLRDEDSVILWHDCGKSYEKTNWEVLSALLDAIPEQEHKYIYRITNSLHAIYTKKALKADFLESPQYPEKVFSVKLKINPFNLA